MHALALIVIVLTVCGLAFAIAAHKVGNKLDGFVGVFVFITWLFAVALAIDVLV